MCWTRESIGRPADGRAANVDSAYGLIADMTGRSCDVRFTPKKQTLDSVIGMSALCHKRTLDRLLNYLADSCEQGLRHRDSRGLRGLNGGRRLIKCGHQRMDTISQSSRAIFGPQLCLPLSQVH